eukprot:364841-Chlamydomonas_euryale.AAC.4
MPLQRRDGHLTAALLFAIFAAAAVAVAVARRDARKHKLGRLIVLLRRVLPVLQWTIEHPAAFRAQQSECHAGTFIEYAACMIGA